MAYADIKAAIVTHALAAGQALTIPLDDVRAGWALPRGRCVRVYWGGETEPQRMGAGRTLNSRLIGQITNIAAFWPASNLSEEQAAVIDAEAQAFAHDLRTRILGDSQLGGQSTDLELELAEPELAEAGGIRYVVVTWRVVSDFAEYTLAP